MIFFYLIFAVVIAIFAFGFFVRAAEGIKQNKWFTVLWASAAALYLGIVVIYTLMSVFKVSDRMSTVISGIASFIGAGWLGYQAYLYAKQQRKAIAIDLGLVAITAVLFGLAGITYTPDDQTSSSSEHNIVGQKLSKAYAKNHDDMYYTDKDDKNIRYFVNDDNKITAVKYVFGADHYPFSSVESELSNSILHDDHLKYTTDKDSRDDFDPDGDSFNVYSPDRQKWYHVKMQRDDDDKISSFTVWPGQSDDADDY